MLREIIAWCGVLMLFIALLTVTVTFVLVLIIEVDRDFIDPATAQADAVILEPLVQGAAGMVMQPDGYLAAVRAHDG